MQIKEHPISGSQPAGPFAADREIGDDDLTMVAAFDDELAPLPMPFHADLAMEQVQAHFDAVMAKDPPEPLAAPQPMSAFR